MSTTVNHVLQEIDQAADVVEKSGKKIRVRLGIGGYHEERPDPIVKRALRRALHTGSPWEKLFGEYPKPQGFRSVREAFINFQARDLGITDLEGLDACITSGARPALHLIMHGLIKPGQKVFMDCGGYGGSYKAVVDAGGIPIPILRSRRMSHAEGIRDA